MKKVLAIALLAAACNQVTNPVVDNAKKVEESCKRAVAGLQADFLNGMSCEDARKKAFEAEPMCPLSFICPK